jgi:hypothetical protein
MYRPVLLRRIVILKKSSKECGGGCRAYLRRCLRFEKEALSLLHVLGGCGNRATGEFESLYFRNTGTAMVRLG